MKTECLSQLKRQLHCLLDTLEADVAIYTSAVPHKILLQDSDNRLNVLALPVAVVKELSVSMRKPYYDHGFLTITRNDRLEMIPAISVVSYLIVSDSAKEVVVAEISESIEKFIEYSMENNIFQDTVAFVDAKIAEYPFDMHRHSEIYSKRTLINAVLSNSLREWIELLFYGVIIVLIFGWLVSRRISEYDSLGLIKTNKYSNRLWSAFLFLSRYAIGFVLWIVWIQIIATVIMWRENIFAVERGIESPLDGFGVWDRTLWLIKVAFTNLPGEIPLSPFSAMLIPLAPLFGLGVFILFAYKIVTVHQQKKKIE